VLIEAVQRCLAGHPYIEQALAIQLACQRGGCMDEHPHVFDLTPRELEIFIMLARGFPLRKIADHLCISYKTVSNHVSLLKNKLGQESQAGLVHLALESGVISGGGGMDAIAHAWVETLPQEMLVHDAGV